MSIGIATANLRHSASEPALTSRFLPLLLEVEAWLDARASRRSLHRLDDRALADIGLARADLERADPAGSWQSVLWRVHG